jgi:hypothetical protein
MLEAQALFEEADMDEAPMLHLLRRFRRGEALITSAAELFRRPLSGRARRRAGPDRAESLATLTPPPLALEGYIRSGEITDAEEGARYTRAARPHRRVAARSQRRRGRHRRRRRRSRRRRDRSWARAAATGACELKGSVSHQVAGTRAGRCSPSVRRIRCSRARRRPISRESGGASVEPRAAAFRVLAS